MNAGATFVSSLGIVVQCGGDFVQKGNLFRLRRQETHSITEEFAIKILLATV